MALTAPGMENELFPRAPAAPGVWVSLLESPGCQAAWPWPTCTQYVPTYVYPGIRDWGHGPLLICWSKIDPTAHRRKLPEDLDTSTPKPWSPRWEKPKNSGGGFELVSVWDETSQGGWPLEHPVPLLGVLYVSCGMPPKDPSPPPIC